MRKLLLACIPALIISGCGQGRISETDSDMITIMTLAPGHFHAALVQKNMYPGVDSQVYVYAPSGPETEDYLARIDAFNSRAERPTAWKSHVYRGDDFLEKMLEEKPGNLVTLAGNNRNKTEYILECIRAGLNVLSDKPMAISRADYELLEEAFNIARDQGLLLYDIMTERFEITTILQREFSMQEAIFGSLQEGTAEDPAITKESVHHFSKVVSGIPLRRPPWFFDVEQEGEAIADVGTHLVDMVQWEAFPGTVYENDDVQILNSRRWTTPMNRDQFEEVTGMNDFPEYLDQYVEADTLRVVANSSIGYTLKGVHAKVSVEWKYRAPEGAGDTHYSIMRGTLSDLIIRQGPDEAYRPTLYIRAAEGIRTEELAARVDLFLQEELLESYPGVSAEMLPEGLLRIHIPNKYRIGHEAHFEQVTRQFLEYMDEGRIPEEEIRNMLVKYHTTTLAVEMAE